MIISITRPRSRVQRNGSLSAVYFRTRARIDSNPKIIAPEKKKKGRRLFRDLQGFLIGSEKKNIYPRPSGAHARHNSRPTDRPSVRRRNKTDGGGGGGGNNNNTRVRAASTSDARLDKHTRTTETTTTTTRRLMVCRS